MSAEVVCVMSLIGLPIYFIPSVVAYYRNHTNLLGIFLMNLFLGWLLVGWVGALVWAVLAGQVGAKPTYQRANRGQFDFEEESAPVVSPVPATLGYACPHCRSAVPVPATLIGRIVSCVACGHPFTATPPTY